MNCRLVVVEDVPWETPPPPGAELVLHPRLGDMREGLLVCISGVMLWSLCDRYNECKVDLWHDQKHSYNIYFQCTSNDFYKHYRFLSEPKHRRSLPGMFAPLAALGSGAHCTGLARLAPPSLDRNSNDDFWASEEKEHKYIRYNNQVYNLYNTEASRYNKDTNWGIIPLIGVQGILDRLSLCVDQADLAEMLSFLPGVLHCFSCVHCPSGQVDFSACFTQAHDKHKGEHAHLWDWNARFSFPAPVSPL